MYNKIMFIYFLIFFILGLFVGSFLNVVIYRYNSSLPLVSGRSKCFSCGKELSFFEMIPFLSFIFQRGKCTACQSKISIQYPVVEFLTGLIFALVFYRQYSLIDLYLNIPNGLVYLSALTLFYLVISSILIVIIFYDIRHKIIPNGLVYGFIILSFVKLVYFILRFGSFYGKDLYDLLAPVLLFLFFGIIWLVSSGRWLGFGDVKLVFGIGALLGFTSGISAIVLGFWAGTAYIILYFILSKIFPQKFGGVYRGMEIPFAPFLIAGLFISLFAKVDVLSLSYFIN